MEFHNVVVGGFFAMTPGINLGAAPVTAEYSVDGVTYVAWPLTFTGNSVSAEGLPVGLVYVRFTFQPGPFEGVPLPPIIEVTRVLNDEALACRASKCRDRVLDYYAIALAMQCTGCDAAAADEAYAYLTNLLPVDSSVSSCGCDCR